MKKLATVLVVLVVAIVAVAILVRVSTFISDTNDVVILSTVITNETIQLRGGFSGSQVWFSDYDVEKNGDSLYVKIVGSSIKFPWMEGDPFVVIIPNTYGDIDAIYLQGGDPSDQELIWSKQDNLE